MIERHARDLIDRYVEDLLNGPDPLTAASELLAADFVFVGPGNAAGIRGAEAFAVFQGVMRAALADLRFDLIEAIVDGDAVALVLRMTGRQVAAFAGVEAAGAAVDLRFVDILRLQGDRIGEITAYLDAADLRRQLTGG